jgi:hypothetical protein
VVLNPRQFVDRKWAALATKALGGATSNREVYGASSFSPTAVAAAKKYTQEHYK